VRLLLLGALFGTVQGAMFEHLRVGNGTATPP